MSGDPHVTLHAQTYAELVPWGASTESLTMGFSALLGMSNRFPESFSRNVIVMKGVFSAPSTVLDDPSAPC